MTPQEEKTLAKQAAFFMIVSMVLIALLALDLLNRGLVWRMLQTIRHSPNNTSLPGEKRTVGKNNRADITFIS